MSDKANASAAQAVAATTIAVDRDAHTITLTRSFDSPRTQIFEAWTRSEHVACWWDPAGDRLVVCEIDLRLGGAFRFVTRSHPDMPFAGIYREITPPDHLVFEAMGATGRVILKEDTGMTHMTVAIECVSSEQLEQYLKMGIDVGTARTLDNLGAYVGVTA